jgi:hypothetical protein
MRSSADTGTAVSHACDRRYSADAVSTLLLVLPPTWCIRAYKWCSRSILALYGAYDWATVYRQLHTSTRK